MLEGVNDSPDDARRLARLLTDIKAKVNLIPLNAAPGIPFERPSDARVDAFAQILADRARHRVGAQEPRPRHPRRLRPADRRGAEAQRRPDARRGAAIDTSHGPGTRQRRIRRIAGLNGPRYMPAWSQRSRSADRLTSGTDRAASLIPDSEGVVFPHMGDPIDEAAARKGSAELLILAALEDGQLHGYDIAREICAPLGRPARLSRRVALSAALRLEDRGWIGGRWVEKAGQRRRRCYRLTAEGRRVLAAQRGRWSSFVHGADQSRRAASCLTGVRSFANGCARRCGDGAGGESVDEIAQHLADVYRSTAPRRRRTRTALALVEAEFATDGAARRRRAPPSADAAPITHIRPAARGCGRSPAIAVTPATVQPRPGYTALVVVHARDRARRLDRRVQPVQRVAARPLPYPDPDRLVLVWEYAGDPTSPFIVAAPNYLDWTRDSQSFDTRHLGIPHVQSRRGR